MESLRKRNVSDGDSGFDSALSSRSSSISLEESQELSDFKVSKVEVKEVYSPLREKFSHILDQQEDIFQDGSTPNLFIIKDRVSGRETQYKPPSRLKFNTKPQVEETYSSSEYNRSNPIPRSQLFSSRLQLELEKQVAKMELVEIDLVMDSSLVPPPSLGIRVIGVNMIHGVPDKLNIYVKRILEGSVAGQDGRIRVNDHIVEVNGTSLVGVSQKVAADALSSCAVNPDTGLVHFTLAREKETAVETDPCPAPAAAAELAGELAPQVKITEESTLAVAGELTPAVIIGQATSFMPMKRKTLFPPPNLSELPAALIVKITSYLSSEDRVSLSKVNMSFYQALKHNEKPHRAPSPPMGQDTAPSPPRGPDTAPSSLTCPDTAPSPLTGQVTAPSPPMGPDTAPSPPTGQYTAPSPPMGPDTAPSPPKGHDRFPNPKQDPDLISGGPGPLPAGVTSPPADKSPVRLKSVTDKPVTVGSDITDRGAGFRVNRNVLLGTPRSVCAPPPC